MRYCQLQLMLSAITLFLVSQNAQAFDWQRCWWRPDQLGLRSLQANQPERARQLFQDPLWRSVADYRAGHYADSVELLKNIKTPFAHYNRGNALARLGRYQDAIAAYDEALALSADYPDAKHNRDLLKKLLKQSQQKPEPNNKKQDQQANDQKQDQQQPKDQQQPQSQQQSSQPKDQQQSQSQQQSSQPKDQQQSQSHQQSSQQQQRGDQQSQPQHDDQPTQQQNQQSSPAATGEPVKPTDLQQSSTESSKSEEQGDPALQQWLRQIPDDPGGLLREKFLRDHERSTNDTEDLS